MISSVGAQSGFPELAAAVLVSPEPCFFFDGVDSSFASGRLATFGPPNLVLV